MAVYTDGQYEAKGWVPFHKIAPNDKRRELLPVNFVAMMSDQKAIPVASDATKRLLVNMDKAKAKADA